MTQAWTILKLLQWTADYFGERGIGSARLEAELLLAFSLNFTRVRLYTDFDRPLQEHELKIFKGLVKRRAEREPLAYIVGSKEFYSLEFKVDPSVLIPRPETELLVEEGIRLLQNPPKPPFSKGGNPESPPLKKGDERGFNILDVGTGSGCIAVALAKNLPFAHLTAVDVSEAALKLARENAERHGVADRIQFRLFDLESEADLSFGPFDLIVSNPPYVSSLELSRLAPELFHEPQSALDGGGDGLRFYPPLFEFASKCLAPQGALLLEMGEGQGESLRRLGQEKGFKNVEVISDLAGKPRALKAMQHIP